MPKRIPTLVGIFLTLFLVGGLAFAASLLNRVTSLFSNASSVLTPSTPVTTANITDSGFTVYWTTDQESTGSVSWGKTKNLADGVAIDDRGSEKFISHFVRIAGLAPQTKYYFKIVSDTTIYDVTTGPKLTNIVAVEPIFGKVLDNSGSPASGVIANVDDGKGTKIAALSKSDGMYVLPIGNVFGDASETITLIASSSEKALIVCKPGLDKPLPTVKLGENLDCNKATLPPKTFQIASTSGELKVNLLDGETVSSDRPTFSGKAGANQVVKIEVHSATTYSGTIKANTDGSWSWTPPVNLSAGEHTVVITVQNQDGTTQTVTRTFNISSTEPILPITSGTPSANLSHKGCLNNSCLDISGAGPDTCIANNDCAPSPVATPTPIPVPVVVTPQTGAVENSFILLTMGLVFATLGMIIAKVI